MQRVPVGEFQKINWMLASYQLQVQNKSSFYPSTI